MKGSTCNWHKEVKMLGPFGECQAVGWTDRDPEKASVKEVVFATWTFSSSSETILLLS